MKNSKNFFYGMLLVSMSLLASSGFGGDLVGLSLNFSSLIAAFLGNVYSLVYSWQFIPFVGGIVLIVFGIIKE